MGVIRFLLAMTVVVDHYGGVLGYQMGSGSVAVEAFFIISGFYMALVLQDRYAGRLKLFYTNRYLRLFPSYFAILLLTLIVGIATGAHSRFTLPMDELGAVFMAGDFWTKAYIVVSNLGIVLLDAALFLSFDGESLSLTTDFTDSAVPVYQFLLIPQGWSLGLEIYFYALAPFLLVKGWRIAAGFALSLGVFIALSITALPSDPWTHRFFPSILFMFLAGSLSWKLLRHRLDAPWMKKLGLVLLVLSVVVILALNASPFGKEVTRFLLLTLIAISVGPVFALVKDNRYDRALGDLSYPIYVAHLLAFIIAGEIYAEGQALLGTVLTILISLALVYAIERPLDRYRHARLQRRKDAKTGEAGSS